MVYQKNLLKEKMTVSPSIDMKYELWSMAHKCAPCRTALNVSTVIATVIIIITVIIAHSDFA